MASDAQIKREFLALLDQYWPEIAKAYQSSIQEITNRVVLKQVVDALKAGNIEAAVAALHIEAAAFGPLITAIEQTFIAGGVWAAKSFTPPPGQPFVLRFDWRNPRAETWLKQHSSTLITSIVEEQLTQARDVLVSGMAHGQNPNRTAIDLVGRVNRATGNRDGGIIGLSEPLKRYRDTALQELLSGDPAQMRNYLTRERRDKRFDRTIAKAISEGRAVNADDAAKIVGRYSDKLLAYRGEIIGRTESLTALNTAEDEAFRQGLDKTDYTEADVTREWDSAGDRRVRHTHAVMDGQKVQGLEQPFRSPSGALLKFPGDRSLGAPAGEVIACRCRIKRKIDFFARFRNG